jgi:transcriptional regulator with XRE-family HTH domain
MNGLSVRKLREALGLNAHAFADILGVAVSTLYRWESAGGGNIRAEPLQLRILEALSRKVADQKAAQRRALAEATKNALIVGGALVALAILLDAIKEGG